MTTKTYVPNAHEGKGGNNDVPPVATGVPDHPENDRVITLLQRHDIPAMFWDSFITYARTGHIRGAEFRARLATLRQFRDCLTEMRALTRRDYPVGDSFSTHTFD